MRGPMKVFLNQLKEIANTVKQNRKLRNRLGWGVGIFLVLQLYFVRELIAAELLFGALFVVLLALAGIFYVVGTIGERSLDWAEAGVRVVGTSARRGYAAVEEISKRPVRHPHSESAQ